MQPFEPVFLLAGDIPVVYVGAVLGPLAAAVAALWKWQNAAIERERATSKEAWDAVRDAATSSAEVITVVRAMGEANHEIRRDLATILRQLERMDHRNAASG